MDFSPNEESIADFLFAVRSKGVRVWSEDGQLRYQAPRGALADGDVQLLRKRKPEIVAFLSRKSELGIEGIRIAPREGSGPVPVTPNQHWRLRTLHPGYSMRSVFPIHLSGQLDVELLKQTFINISMRHESLRTQFIFSGHDILQDVRTDPASLSMVDLSTVPEACRMAEVRRIIDYHNHDKIDPTSDPLFMGTLLRLGETEFVLLTHCHDCISDATSGGIFSRDFWTLYVQSVRKMKSSLSPVPIQQPDFAVWLQRSESHWNKQHYAYWKNRLSGAVRARLFPRESPPPTVRNHIAIFQSRIGSDVTTALRALGRQRQTSLGMIVMTAWTAMMLRWCNTSDIVLAFLTSGRIHSEVRNSIGCFMSPLYLRIEIGEHDRLVDLTSRITEEYGTAYEHHDFGRLLTHESDVECLKNPIFNWLPREVLVDPATVIMSAGGGGLVNELKILPFDYQPPPRHDVKWDLEPAFAFIETDDKIIVRIYYRADRIAVGQVQRLAENVERFAALFCEDPTAEVSSLSCA
jgi:hypothetical protein